ncbi:AraC family transcriptional regulator [Streptomyces sp. R302]|uniref:AraC family transcriptional regulator n=1 Tax=unclassified Streptomyces TaxID=2593676 RepID=UPI00145E75FF|nr:MULTISPECIES: AraC family transcriptional regulator [unclassified Streptomyces]NML50137.1 AraC family transcriptional regulator [Streptomyces sp. R301]NML79128.1 AraC family transcriptional regulator [Streptomyces sp. R302]
MDPLTSLLQEVRSCGAVFGRNLLEPPWAVRFADQGALTLVTLLRGEGWIVPEGTTGEERRYGSENRYGGAGGAVPVRLGPGDVAVVTGPEPFSITDDPAAATPPLFVVHPDRCTTADGCDIGEDVILGLRTCGNSEDGPTVLLTASYQATGRVSERLLGGLPRTLLVPHDAPDPVLELAAVETGRDAPGQQAVLDRLLDLLLLSTLREWFARPEACPPGWYRALGDPVAGRALRLIHARPERAWTVDALAAEAGVSRATLARRFTALVGRPPMAYLTEWRLTLAADLLARTDATVASIARQVGYRTPFALSAALKRVHDTRPVELRAATGGAPTADKPSTRA